jgi:hypothetical protein
VGKLDQDAGPVAGGLVGARRPAVHQVQEHLLAVLDNRVAAAPRHADDRPNAAGVVFLRGIVQAAGFGCSQHRDFHL